MGETKNTEVGIIGQNYEDRRTHKAGKLISRDDKYKTLMFESADGKSFNVSYSTFRSNYRKSVVADEFEQAEDNVEVTPIKSVEQPVQAEVPKEEVKKEKKPSKKKGSNHITVSSEEMLAIAMDVLQNNILYETVTIVEVPAHRALAVKLGVNRVIELYAQARANKYRVCVHSDVFGATEFPFVFGDSVIVEHHDDWRLKDELLITPDFLPVVMDSLMATVSDVAGKLKNNESEEE